MSDDLVIACYKCAAVYNVLKNGEERNLIGHYLKPASSMALEIRLPASIAYILPVSVIGGSFL